jgi:hypothetical protein
MYTTGLNLPLELLYSVLVYVQLRDIICLSLCSRRFYHYLTNDEVIWKNLYDRYFGHEPLGWHWSILNVNHTHRKEAVWRELFRRRYDASSIWIHRKLVTYKVPLPGECTSPTCIEHFKLSPRHSDQRSSISTQSGSICCTEKGPVKLLASDSSGIALIARTEPLSIYVIHYTQNEACKPTVQLHTLLPYPDLDQRWQHVDFAPPHMMHGLLTPHQYAVVTMSAIDQYGQWMCGIWIWHLVDQTLLWHDTSEHVLNLSMLRGHWLLYSEDDMSTNEGQRETFGVLDLRRDGEVIRGRKHVAVGAPGSCHLHLIDPMGAAHWPPTPDTDCFATIYRQQFIPSTQTLIWRLDTLDGELDTRLDHVHKREHHYTLMQYGLASYGQVHLQDQYEVSQLISTQVDNGRVVVAGVSRDGQDRSIPFLLLLSLRLRDQHFTSQPARESILRSVLTAPFGTPPNYDPKHLDEWLRGESLQWLRTGPRYHARALLPIPGRNQLCIMAPESMLRVASLIDGTLLHSLPGLSSTDTLHPLVGSLCLTGVSAHGRIMLMDVAGGEAWQRQLDEATEAVQQVYHDGRPVSIEYKPSQVRPELVRQQWSAGILGLDVLACIRARSLLLVRAEPVTRPTSMWFFPTAPAATTNATTVVITPLATAATNAQTNHNASTTKSLMHVYIVAHPNMPNIHCHSSMW